MRRVSKKLHSEIWHRASIICVGQRAKEHFGHKQWKWEQSVQIQPVSCPIVLTSSFDDSLLYLLRDMRHF